MPIIDRSQKSQPVRPLFELDEDSVKGFEQAVRNGQTRLALEYSVQVIKDLREQVAELQGLFSAPSPQSDASHEVAAEVKGSKKKSAKAEENDPSDLA